MNPGVIGVFIPIIMVLVIGLILIAYFYFRFRERQMLIEKGLSADSIKEYFERKRDPSCNRMLKIGIICIFFGIGLGLGLMLEDYTGREYYVAFSLFTITGIGFVVANLLSKKFESKDPAK